MELKKYPDGTSYYEAELNVQRENILFRINTYEDLWHLNQFVDAYNQLSTHPPRITIPNLIDAQADRRFEVNQSSGLKLVCEFLNNMNAYFEVFHPHNPDVVEAIIDKVSIISNQEFIDKVLMDIAHLPTDYGKGGEPLQESLILMSPDAGAYKNLSKLSESIDWYGDVESAVKSRRWNKEEKESELIQSVNRDDFQGKDILIVDDICVYGGTFKGIAKILKTKNIGKLYLAVSHMTVQRHKDSELFDLFDMVYTTNSKYDCCFVPDKEGGVLPKNLSVLKLF